ncbi:unnamed protein product [Hymenolepis diminuta]|uniref:Beta-galactosidase n=1 Tax=Hymenolepis diminuta TaxID=6216 RepID=A0A564YMT1_HYMDI|nr:unnamed protein product [Hymenolepis diminuta]
MLKLEVEECEGTMKGGDVESENYGGRLKLCEVIPKILFVATAISALTFFFCCYLSSPRTFFIDTENRVFVKDGKPFRFISGSMHYFRIPRIYWMDRLMKAKAAGLDAIQTYIPWNFHEVHPGEYLFDNERDVIEFIQLANSLDLLVLLRVGPYICAEWDFGGLPSWLLSDNPYLKIRSTSPEYINSVIRWFSQLLPKLKPLLYQNGGPIIMIQLENEYGSYFTCEQEYLSSLYEYTRFILGDEILLYTTDGNSLSNLKCGSSDRRLFSTVDFGVDGAINPNESFKALMQFQPYGPLVNSEYYTGWIDHWGDKKHRVDASKLANGAAKILNMSDKVSLNLYMFHGGTNFGFWSGANSASDITITSYDYDAPISEAGDTTYKYMILRDLFFKIKNREPLPIPPNISKAAYGKASVNFYSHLIYDLKEGVHSIKPLHMEAVKQYQGFMAYSVVLEERKDKASLNFEHVKDVGYVFATDPGAKSIVYFGSLAGQGALDVTLDKEHPILTIVTESQGHINFGSSMMGDVKGIVGRVLLDGQELLNWDMKGLDFRAVNPPYLVESEVSYPDSGAIYKGVFTVPSPPADTFAVLQGFKRVS